MTPFFAREGSTPSVLGDAAGCLIVLLHTLYPFVESMTTWNFGAFFSVTLYRTKLLPKFTWIRRGAARFPSYMSSSCHQVLVLPVGNSPPRPSMVPVPTTPELFGSVTLMSALHDELPVLLPAHLPSAESKARGFGDANSIVPVSSQRVTPDFSDSGPDTNATLSPSAARRTARPRRTSVQAVRSGVA